MKKKFALRISMVLLIVISSITTSCATKPQNNALIHEITEWRDTERYYYQQLTEEEKEIYDWLNSQKEAFLSLRQVSMTIAQSKTHEKDYYISLIQKARDAYIRDIAEAKIFLQNYKSYFNCSNEVKFILKPIQGAKSSEEILELFEEKANEIAQTIQGRTDEEKLRQINDYLTENVSYDQSRVLENTHNAYGALINGEAVCDGYATAFKYIADLCGLSAIYVQGKVDGDEHAWNMVYIDGEWLSIDTTFNAGTKTHKFFLFSSTETYEPDLRFVYE